MAALLPVVFVIFMACSGSAELEIIGQRLLSTIRPRSRTAAAASSARSLSRSLPASTI